MDSLITALDQGLITPLKALQSPSVSYRKLLLELHLDKETAFVSKKAPLTSLRHYQNYKLTFQSNVRGSGPKQETNEGVLSYSLYPETSNEGATADKGANVATIETTVDRPGRFLVPGSCIDPDKITTSKEIEALREALNTAIPLYSLNQPSGFVLKPVIESLGNIVNIRAVQFVGYTRVAGMKKRGLRGGTPVNNGGENK